MDTYGSIESNAPTSGSNNATESTQESFDINAVNPHRPGSQEYRKFELQRKGAIARQNSGSVQMQGGQVVQASGNTSPSEMSKTNVNYPKGKNLIPGASIPHKMRGPLLSGRMKVKSGVIPQPLPGYDPNQQYYTAKPGKVSKNLHMKLDPNMRQAVNMLAYDYMLNKNEYQAKTKEKLPDKLDVVNSFRTREEQEFFYRSPDYKANPPGASTHEYGLAVDLDIPQANVLDKMGVLAKYGLFRPLPNHKDEKQHVQTKMVVEANTADQKLTAPPAKGDVKATQEVDETIVDTTTNGNTFRGEEPVGGNTGTSMRPYAKPNDAIGLPDSDPATSGITGGFAQPEFPISPTQQMQSVQDQQIAKQDAISLAKTEELLDKQVKLQEENNNIVREIASLIKQKSEEKPQGLRNTNAQAAEMKSEEERMKEEAQRRVADGNMRVGPIMTSV